MAGYWEGRKELNYYRDVRRILDELGPRESILDVGPMDTPVVTWGQFERRYTVGPDVRARLDGVTAIRGLWPGVADEIQLPVDVVMCLQVIEHLPDTLSFAAALFRSANELAIISVPYQWPESACHYHVHDPIDEEKLTQLVGRTADRVEIVNDGGWRRMIAQYDTAAQDSRLPLPAIGT